MARAILALTALLLVATGCRVAPREQGDPSRRSRVDPAVGEFESWSLLALGPSTRETVTLEPAGGGRMNNAAVVFALGTTSDIAIYWRRSGDVIVIEPRLAEYRMRLAGVWLARLNGKILTLTLDPVAREDVHEWKGSGVRARMLWTDQSQLRFRPVGSGAGKWLW